MDEYFKYFITTSSEDWSLDNFTEWCAVNVSCEKKKILDYMKKTMKESLKQSFSEDLKPKVIQMLEDFEAWKSSRNQGRETVQLAEIKSKNFEFHKNIAGDLVTIDHKRKMSPSDEYVEQEEYDMKPTSAESFKKRILNFDYSSESSIEERKDEAEDSEDPEDDILDFSNVTFDGWVETYRRRKDQSQRKDPERHKTWSFINNRPVIGTSFKNILSSVYYHLFYINFSLLNNSLEVLYFFKENVINKAKYLSFDDGNNIKKNTSFKRNNHKA
ncbi:hypothetical protein GLOIN_2v1765777 [Rhizophagus clarus]|uniref:Uncharacterized protein n=1 Tax=Rhizophagus clarus TaxID=94130 RepID=A0A8H3M950_9GLOM|nr:hypothetical protein GLOIN_2v1765777 [Rhizophagus clarus]